MAVLASNNALLPLGLGLCNDYDHCNLIAAKFTFQKRCRRDNIQCEPMCPGTGSSKSLFLTRENKETDVTLR